MGCGNSKNTKKDTAMPEKKEPETQPGNENEKATEGNGDQKTKGKENKDGQGEDPEGNLDGGIEFDEAMEKKRLAEEKVAAAEKKRLQGLAFEQEMLQKANFSDLSDLPLYRQENPDFGGFGGGDLSPITTPTGKKRQKTPQTKQEQPQPRKVVVKRQKVTPFNWGNEGRVEIKSISYKIKYNFLLKSFRTLKAKDDYQTTILSWSKNEDEDVLEFVLKDTFLTNLRTGIDVPLNSPQLEFQVDPDGKFIKITNIEEFTDKLLEIQGKKEVMTKKQRKRYKKMMDMQFHRNWNTFVEDWLLINKPQNQDLIADRYQQYGTDVIVASKMNIRDEDELKENLKAKLLNEKTYYRMLGSKNMIRDNFKKWRLHEDSSKKISKFTGEDQPEMHRNIRLNFFLTSKYDTQTALIDARTIRPFITNTENARKIVFDVNRDLYIDVEYEAKSSLFLWDDCSKEINLDDYLVDEMVKFQDTCDEALQDIIEELSEIKRVPLVVRFERPKLEDERMIDDENQQYEEDPQYEYDPNIKNYNMMGSSSAGGGLVLNGKGNSAVPINGSQIGQNKGKPSNNGVGYSGKFGGDKDEVSEIY